MGIKAGFTSLFNGKDLTGWVGDLNYWKVEDGAIVGRSVEKLDRNLFRRCDEHSGAAQNGAFVTAPLAELQRTTHFEWLVAAILILERAQRMGSPNMPIDGVQPPA